MVLDVLLVVVLVLDVLLVVVLLAVVFVLDVLLVVVLVLDVLLVVVLVLDVLLVVVLLAVVFVLDVLLVVALDICVSVVPFVSEEFWTDSVLETVSLSERTPTVTPPEAAAVTRKTAKTTEMKTLLRIALTPRTIGLRRRVPAVAFRSGRLFVAVV
ncbi:hypothetical protein EXE43_08080 [Halorubrum sp. SS5]|nr:hypothetical protein EXE43_08080 [Halorubrum sp. SS5]